MATRIMSGRQVTGHFGPVSVPPEAGTGYLTLVSSCGSMGITSGKDTKKETNANMKTYIDTQLLIVRTLNTIFVGSLALILAFGFSSTRADETCSSPYLARIEGQEEFVYVWTLGVEGLGDGSDKLVTIDVKPGSPAYGKAVSAISVGGRNEAHHGGFTD